MMTMLCPYLNSLGIDQQHPGFRSAETRDYNLKIALQQILTVSVTVLVASVLACHLAAALPVDAIRVPLGVAWHDGARYLGGVADRAPGQHQGRLLRRAGNLDDASAIYRVTYARR
ncbi:hypothetical protein KQH49_02740 [Mycetohabitans sp. B5]|uniref:hypothetical protein n=1 Tax=Mycetohabitans TaxID=2571159 RepID=UPI0011B05E9B|nr:MULTISPECIES: hypothetical protein [Mycetohabitans]MCG1053939.1 hypothetical protein [Mycetohabitans sp. B5]